jgi:hypothetical protein
MFLLFAQEENSWEQMLQSSGKAIVIFFCTTVASFLVGRWYGRYRSRKQWESREFLGRLLVSLNIFQEGFLKVRTILERNLDDVFINPEAARKVRAAALLTTADNPILPLAAEDSRFLRIFLINAISECFREGLVRYDGGHPLRPVVYLVFLTCEVLDETMLRKIRVMMVRKDVMANFPYMDSLPRLEQTKDQVRIKTLRQSAAIYTSAPDHFHEIELYL